MKSLLLVLSVAMMGRCDPPDSPIPPEADAGPEEPTRQELCQQACPKFRAVGCGRGIDQCSEDGFGPADENGDMKCVEFITCEQACVQEPQAFPDLQCVIASSADTCETLNERCP